MRINGLFLCALGHADDLRTMASNVEDTTHQASFINSFTRSRGPLSSLGVWWDNSSSSHVCVKERIQKARATFFTNGQLGAFHGLLNPLSPPSIIESCVFPVLLYGSEKWVLNHRLLQALESFQAEFGRRILKLSLN